MVSGAEPPLVYDAKEKSDEEAAMERELAMEELIALINSQKGVTLLSVSSLEKEAVSDAKEE